MATGNTRKREVVEASTNKESHLISTSRRILQDLADLYINPEESVSFDAESASFQTDLNSETPNKYPNAPHPSPIDLQNETNRSIFNEELVKCLNELPVMLLALEEKAEDSAEILEIGAEYPPGSYFEASTCSGSNLKSVIASSHLEWTGNRKLSKPFSANLNNQVENFECLGMDSFEEFNTDFYRTSILNDTSLIVNCSDESDTSFDEVESVPSDDSSCASRDSRIWGTET